MLVFLNFSINIDTIVFDNSHSYLRSKKLRYWVSLSSEESEQQSQDCSHENKNDNSNVYSLQTEDIK